MRASSPPRTRIARHTEAAVYVRDYDLVQDLIGKLSFTEMIVLQLTGRMPTALQTRILDAVLVTLMEHGFTPSSIVARLIYDSTPEAMQSAVAAGLLGVGGTFIGTMEGAACLIDDILQAGEGAEARARKIATEHAQRRNPVPGFGHPFHKPDDPRSPKLLALARESGAPGRHIEALELLSREVDAAFGRHLTINVTGAVAALLGEIDIPQKIMRGLAVVSRAAGLVGHIHEEQELPTARHVWGLVQREVPYEENPR
ncbi:citryl-CoA lyase [Pseudorhodoferax soli]|uniref:citrate synthase (unknown stereospecificity) n=1 Tax=Pseudorhodoferax soli TaxID=545864 RepID=A0A368XKW3_9BURK|nr:citryl-CoA lyase [Pseudorhodoferax soli]RCW68495.1 citrate synthase [Pseudorhodoferax soli]